MNITEEVIAKYIEQKVSTNSQNVQFFRGKSSAGILIRREKYLAQLVHLDLACFNSVLILQMEFLLPVLWSVARRKSIFRKCKALNQTFSCSRRQFLTERGYQKANVYFYIKTLALKN